MNLESVIGNSHDDSKKSIKDVHVFPRFMKSCETSYISGTNEVYPIGFTIPTGNEDGNVEILERGVPNHLRPGFQQ